MGAYGGYGTDAYSSGAQGEVGAQDGWAVGPGDEEGWSVDPLAGREEGLAGDGATEAASAPPSARASPSPAPSPTASPSPVQSPRAPSPAPVPPAPRSPLVPTAGPSADWGRGSPLWASTTATVGSANPGAAGIAGSGEGALRSGSGRPQGASAPGPLPSTSMFSGLEGAVPRPRPPGTASVPVTPFVLQHLAFSGDGEEEGEEGR